MISAVLPLLMALAAAAPQNLPKGKTPVAPQEEICVTVIQTWSGSIRDTRRIGIDPVPESYRSQYSWTGCQMLAKGMLIDWHLAFGNEASTSSALQFLADTALAGIPSPEKFERTLPIAWRDAQRSRSPDAARALIDAHDRFLFLAEQYLYAAEFFRSPALLAAGTRYFSATMRGLDVLFGGARIAMAENGFPQPYGVLLSPRTINLMRNLEMRYAIARARISGSPADWKQAGDIVEANIDPVARDFQRVAFDRNHDYCNSDNISSDIKDACDSENDLSGRLRAFWLNAELVAQFTDGEVTPARKIEMQPFDGFDTAMAVISATTVPITGSAVFWHDDRSDDQVQLWLARAESRYRKSRAQPLDSTEARMLRYEALSDLGNAERLVSAFLNPNRFRQIAELYLQIYGAVPSDEQSMLSQPAREAAYLRVVLARLDDIATGVQANATH